MFIRILCSIVAFICISSSLNANVGWPGLVFFLNYFENGYVFWISIISGLTIEFTVLKLMCPQERSLKIAGVTLLMNIVSSTIGFIVTSVLELLNLFALSSLMIDQNGPFYVRPLILNIFIATVLANTTLEFLIAKIFLKSISNKYLFFALMFANSLSFLIDATTMLLILKRIL